MTASSPEALGELLVGVVLDTDSPAASGGLIVAPISTETQFAADADVLLARDESPLGYEVVVEVWNHGALVLEQLEEHRGLVTESTRRKLGNLYSALYADSAGESDRSTNLSRAEGNGLPILGDADPRLVFQDEEIERAQRFYVPAESRASENLSETGERQEAAAEPVAEVTAGALLIAWFEEAGYEGDDYAHELGVDRTEVRAILSDQIDPTAINADRVGVIFLRPYRQKAFDSDELAPALRRSLLDEADWHLLGSHGTGQRAARTARRKGAERERALRAGVEPTTTPLSSEEIEKRKTSFINDVLSALEDGPDS